MQTQWEAKPLGDAFSKVKAGGADDGALLGAAGTVAADETGALVEAAEAIGAGEAAEEAVVSAGASGDSNTAGRGGITNASCSAGRRDRTGSAALDFR